jgi:hypothetical protein
MEVLWPPERRHESTEIQHGISKIITVVFNVVAIG